MLFLSNYKTVCGSNHGVPTVVVSESCVQRCSIQVASCVCVRFSCDLVFACHHGFRSTCPVFFFFCVALQAGEVRGSGGEVYAVVCRLLRGHLHLGNPREHHVTACDILVTCDAYL